jgi:STE24 endopeptidase
MEAGMSDVYGSDEERARAVRYSRTREWLVLVGVLWEMGVNLHALLSGTSGWLRQTVERVAPRRLGPALPFAGLWLVRSFVISLPLSYVSGYVVEHRFGLSNQTRRAWLLESLKGLGLEVAIGAPLMAGLYWIIGRWPRRWWAVVSALTVPMAVIFTNLMPVLILPLFNTYEPIKNRALAKRIQALAAREGVTVSDVRQMDMSKQTKKANAMFTGVGNTKRIVLGDTMLDTFNDDEIEVVLAHELGHQVHRDLWKLIALSAPISAVALSVAHAAAPSVLRRWGERWGVKPDEGLGDVATLPLLLLLSGGATQVMMPVINGLVRAFVERPADRYALQLTKNPKAFVSAMEKLARMNLSNPKPSALVKYLLYDHPPIGERIAMARRWKKGR